MNHKATIETPYSVEVEKLFKNNDYLKSFKAKVTIKKTKQKIIFTITSREITTLRALFNSITKNLATYQNVKDGIEE